MLGAGYTSKKFTILNLNAFSVTCLKHKPYRLWAEQNVNFHMVLDCSSQQTQAAKSTVRITGSYSPTTVEEPQFAPPYLGTNIDLALNLDISPITWMLLRITEPLEGGCGPKTEGRENRGRHSLPIHIWFPVWFSSIAIFPLSPHAIFNLY